MKGLKLRIPIKIFSRGKISKDKFIDEDFRLTREYLDQKICKEEFVNGKVKNTVNFNGENK